MVPSRKSKTKKRAQAASTKPIDTVGQSRSRFGLRFQLLVFVIFLLLVGGGLGLWLQNQQSPRVSRKSHNNSTSSHVAESSSLQSATLEELESLLSLTPVATPVPMSIQIDVELWTKKVDEALHALRTFYAHDARAEHLFGLVQMRLKRTKLAEPSLKRSLAMEPGNVQMRMDLAKLCMETGRVEEALDVLQSQVNLEQLPVEYLSLLGDCQQQLGQLAEAQRSLEGATQLAPENAGLWKKIASLQLQQLQLQAAEQSVRKSLELSVNDAELWLLLHRTLVLQHKADEARTAIRRWQELHGPTTDQPEDLSFESKHAHAMAIVYSSAFRSIAAIHNAHGDSPSAHAMFENALAVNPRDLVALTAWASQWRKDGDIQKAIDLNRRLVSLQPLEPAHYQNLANLFMEMQQTQKAEATLRLACMRMPGEGKSHLLLARFLLLLNKPREAIAPARSATQILGNREAADVLADAVGAAGSR